MPTGTAGIASVSKWGQKVPVTDEEIARNVYAGMSIDRSLRKTVNSVIKQVDGIAMAAVASAVTAFVPASGTAGGTNPNWAVPATARILFDILNAKATVFKTNLGYKPDTLLLDDLHYAYAMSATNITNALRRETTDNPV